MLVNDIEFNDIRFIIGFSARTWSIELETDITGWKFYFTVKESPDDEDSDSVVQVEWTSHTDPTNGKTNLILTNEQANQFEEKTYYYDIAYIDNVGRKGYVIIGNFIVIKNITKSTD